MRNFNSLQPGDVQTLLTAKKREGQSGIILAGGTNISNYIKQGRLTSGVLIDISRLAELKGVSEEGEFLKIGAATTITDLLESDLLKKRAPFFHDSLKLFANPLIRNLATIGGNIADASPAADTAPVLLVSDAVITAEKRDGKREIPINSFFNLPRKTRLEADEVITSFQIPFQKGQEGVFLKMGNRNSSAISIVSIAVLLERSGGKMDSIRIAAGSVAPRPLRCEKTEAVFLEKAAGGWIPSEEDILKVAQTVKEEVNPIKDVRGSAEWRKELTTNLVARAVRICLGMEE